MGKSLSAADLRKLVGILGRLASDFDGERAAAGLLATRLLRAAGVGWDDLILSDSQQSPGRTHGEHAPPPSGADNLTTCLRWLGELTTWEVGFVTDLRRRPRPLSPAQTAKLAQIACRLRGQGLS